MINIYYVSHLDDKSLVSAVGLGNMIQNAFIIAVICSLNAVIETLVSQAAGNGNLPICGVYLNRALLVLTCTFILLTSLIFSSEFILIKLGQSHSVAAMTKQYMVLYIPGLYIYFLCDLYRRFLNCF